MLQRAVLVAVLAGSACASVASSPPPAAPIESMAHEPTLPPAAPPLARFLGAVVGGWELREVEQLYILAASPRRRPRRCRRRRQLVFAGGDPAASHSSGSVGSPFASRVSAA
jgi:hypothetical protein